MLKAVFNLKKLIIKIIIAVLIIVSLSISALIFFNSHKNIENKCKLIEEKRELTLNTNIWGISHEIENGKKLELTVTQNVSSISEEIYKVDLLINQAENDNYSVKDINLSYRISENDVLISNFYGIGFGEYKEGEISYDSGVSINCLSENNYMFCTFIIKSNSAEHLYAPDAFDLSYDIIGHFPYTANRFYDVNPLKNQEDLT